MVWNWKGHSIRYQYAGNSGPALVLAHGLEQTASPGWFSSNPSMMKTQEEKDRYRKVSQRNAALGTFFFKSVATSESARNILSPVLLGGMLTRQTPNPQKVMSMGTVTFWLETGR
ncbi:hypothetical protein IMY05_016G0003800 [Salix suchowensis]|nr:hypothetical protein IMY05_016G0003800 [Salix suchowensis]